jgi:tetratricopeptide (TPR) repeat protein/predicted Ser/Thr protein kinase
MIGSTISHYRIISKLGEGGMGVVYEAQDTNLDRTVALKFLPATHVEDENERERLRREAKAASALNHPNVCTIYGIEEFEGRQFIEMEFVDGVSLKTMIKNSQLTLENVIPYAIQIGEALAEAHNKGITHRDIKPDNIRVNSRNQIKVMDFGLAKLKGSLQLTRTSTTVGTVAYMSPEQVRGGELDHRSDIFSFGVVLYEMLTGHSPFRREHEAATMYSIVYEDPERFDKYNVEVPPALKQIVFRALLKNPDERYQSVVEMVNDLRNHSVPRGSTIGIPITTTITRRLPKTRVRMLLAAGMILIVASIVVYYVVFNGREEERSISNRATKTFAVMYIENIPDAADKDRTAEMLANLLSTSLSQVKGLVVISRERLYGIQEELGEQKSTLTNPAVATKIAQHAGVTTMLMGSIVQSQPTIALVTHLVDVKSGAIISSQRIQEFSTGRIFSLVDSLAALVRASLDISPEDAGEAKSLSAVTTTSVEAYRSYLAGLELKGKFFDAEAEAAWKKALELDNSFAMAYYKLSTLENTDIESRKRSLQKAFQLRDSVTEKEKMQIEAAYANVIEKNPLKAIDVLEHLVGKYPHEQNIYHMLHSIYRDLWNRDKAIEANVRAVRNDSLDKNAWNNLAYYYADKNLWREAVDAADRYIRLSPAEPNPYDTKGDIYAKFGEGDSAVLWYAKALSFRPDYWTTAEKIGHIKVLKGKYDEARTYFQQYASWPNEANKAWAETDEVIIVMHQGKLRQAQQRLLKIIASHGALKLHEHVLAEYQLLAHIAYERNDNTALLAYARNYAGEVKKDSDLEFQGVDILARGYAATGNSATAKKLLDALDTSDKKGSLAYQVTIHKIRALLAHDEKRYSDAVTEFEQVFQVEPPNYRHYLPYAVCLLNVGRIADAVEDLRRRTYYFYDDIPDHRDWPISSVTSHYWLGVAYERQHEPAKALHEFETVVNMWREADPDLPALLDAKQHAEALKSVLHAVSK